LMPVCMSVNLSVRQFMDNHLLDDIATILKSTGMPPHLLELEITEGMVIHNAERVIKTLRVIKEMGVRIALDDFGTGYSSFGYLREFPVDAVKVDRSFIRDVLDNTEDRAITEAIITMARTLKLNVVAEGVETADQEEFLRSKGCDEVQGYYISRPIPHSQFAALLRSQTEEQRMAE
jgi:EAL domain-containing protein (putative c-di-GMP-specific phosphodiesterase class I)